MVIEAYEIEMQVFYSIVFKDVVLRLQKLTQIQVIQNTCFGKSKELTII